VTDRTCDSCEHLRAELASAYDDLRSKGERIARLVEAAQARRWTTEPPAEPGWYWFRLTPRIIEVVEVVRHPQRAGLLFKTKTSQWMKIEEGGEWCGPIPAPDAAQPTGDPAEPCSLADAAICPHSDPERDALEPCATCGGERRRLVRAEGHEGMVWVDCPDCAPAAESIEETIERRAKEMPVEPCAEPCDRAHAIGCPDLDSDRCVKPHERSAEAAEPAAESNGYPDRADIAREQFAELADTAPAAESNTCGECAEWPLDERGKPVLYWKLPTCGAKPESGALNRDAIPCEHFRPRTEDSAEAITFTVSYHPEPPGGYATVLECPGCISQGTTRDRCIASTLEALANWWRADTDTDTDGDTESQEKSDSDTENPSDSDTDSDTDTDTDTEDNLGAVALRRDLDALAEKLEHADAGLSVQIMKLRSDLAALRIDMGKHCATATDLEELAEKLFLAEEHWQTDVGVLRGTLEGKWPPDSVARLAEKVERLERGVHPRSTQIKALFGRLDALENAEPCCHERGASGKPVPCDLRSLEADLTERIEALERALEREEE